MTTLIEQWINPAALALESKLRKQFSLAQPYAHIVLPDFLIDSQAECLLAALKQEEFTHKESDLFSLSQTVDLGESRNEIIRSFHTLVKSPEFARFMQTITGVAVKPGVLDFSGSLYESGDYLLCHDDQVEDRKLAYIVYLSKGFQASDGAEFVLFNNNGKRPTSVAQAHLPLWNHLMLFAVSPLSFHMVAENCSRKSRYAIGGWLH